MSTLMGTKNGEPSARRKDRKGSINQSTNKETRTNTKKSTKQRTISKKARKSCSSKQPVVEKVQIEELSKERGNGDTAECQSKNGKPKPRNAAKSKN